MILTDPLAGEIDIEFEKFVSKKQTRIKLVIYSEQDYIDLPFDKVKQLNDYLTRRIEHYEKQDKES